MDMERLSELKKIDLHCHLDGSVRLSSLYELLLEAGEIDEQEEEEFKSLVSVGENCDSLKSYLEKFDWPLKVMQSQENLERITYEILEDFSKQNIIYAEIRFAPFLHMEEGLSFDEVLEAVLAGKDRAEEDFDISSNLILIAMRHEEASKSLDLVKSGEKYLDKGVVAVDLAGNEHDFPGEIHQEAIDLAQKLGYKITIHAGETGISENIAIAVNQLHASRIGHGIAAIKDESIMDLLLEKNIYLEMCPISNIDTGAVDKIADYPIRDFIHRGIGVTINTDNTTVSDTSLEDEYRFLMENLDFTLEEIKELIKNSIEAAFISEEEKRLLREKL